MNKELKQIIRQDLGRVYDHPLTIKEHFLFPPEMKYLILWRKASFYRRRYLSRGGLFFHFVSIFYGLRLSHLTRKTQINIPAETTIGAGLYIGHLGRIIIHPDAVLGANVNLATGITIGQCNRGNRKGVPTIGNRVWIGTNAVIVGKITIGDDVLIAPGAYVNMDVPSHSIVIGNPGVIHSSDHATKDYINRAISLNQ